MRWRQGVTFSGAIVVCAERSANKQQHNPSYVTGAALRVR